MQEIRVDTMNEYDTPDKLRKLMYGFSNEINDILFKHFRVTLNEYIENENENLGYIYTNQDKYTSASSQHVEPKSSSQHANFKTFSQHVEPKASSQHAGCKKFSRRSKPHKASSRRSRSKVTRQPR